MAVAFNNSDARSFGLGTTLSFSYTSSSGSDRLLLTKTEDVGIRTVASVAYAAAALTSAGSSGVHEIWRRVAPATGSNTLAFTLSGYGTTRAVTSDWTGVDPTTPTGTAVFTSGTSAAPAATGLTFTTDGALWGATTIGYLGGSPVIGAGSGTTLASQFPFSGRANAGGYRLTSGDLNWTSTGSTTWDAQGIPILPVAGGGGTTVTGVLGTAVASGFKGNVNAARILAGSLGTATASGFKGNVNANRTIAGALGTAVASGFKGNVNANRTIVGTLGVAVASGFQGTVVNGAGTTITGNLGIAVASGFKGNVNANRTIAGNLGVAAASGFTGSVQNGSAPVTDASNPGGYPIPRRKKKRQEDEEEAEQIAPEVVEAVAVVPVARRTLTLEKLIGKAAAAQIDRAELSNAIHALRVKKRQREDEELLLM